MRVNLGDIAEERKESCKTNGSSVPTVGLEHLIPGQIRLTEWDELGDNTFTKVFHKGDVLFGRRRAYLKKAAVAQIEGVCSGDITVITANPDKLYPKLLPFIIQNDSFFDYAVGNSAGSLSPRAKWANIKNFEINLPSLEQQEQLANVLWTIEDTIQSYRLLLEKSDELVKARFVEMFGDLNTNPRGWDTQTFQQSTEFITDGEHSTPKRTDQGIYLLSARNVLNHSLQLEDVDYIDDEEYERIAKRVVPQEGDVLISCSGTVGRCCSIPKGLKCQMVRSVALLRFKPNIIPKFAEYMITSDYVQDQINSQKTASSQANLFQGKIAKLKGIVPPVALQEDFLKFVNQVDKSKVALQKTIEEAQKLLNSMVQENLG